MSVVINNLNGDRNFSKLVDNCATVLANNMSIPGMTLKIFKEVYHAIAEVDMPCINIFLKDVNPVRFDANTSVNECTVAFIVYDSTNDKGTGNSAESKKNVIKIIGQINNIFSKRITYGILSGNVVQSIQPSGIVFSTPEDFNSSQIILGQQEVKFIVTEENDEKYTEKLQQTNTGVNGNIIIVTP